MARNDTYLGFDVWLLVFLPFTLNLLFRFHPGRSMFPAQAGDKEPVRFIHPAGNQGQVREAAGANDRRRRIENMSFCVFTQAEFKLGDEVI
jgi:hypothetical protein